MNRRYLQKFQIKDVVFLAIMSAVALATCAVMPLVISLQPLIFGISPAGHGASDRRILRHRPV